MLDWLKTHWVILAAIVAMSTAWGQQQQKVVTLEQAIINQAGAVKQINELQMQAVRQDEQLKMIKESQLRTEKLIEILARKKETR